MVGLAAIVRLAGRLLRIVVEFRDFLGVHALGREPLRNVVIPQPLDVGEHLGGTGSRSRAGGREGIADQDDFRLNMAFSDNRSAGRILTGPFTVNSPIMRCRPGIIARMDCSGACRNRDSHGSVISR